MKQFELAQGFVIGEMAKRGPMVRLPWGIDPENRFTYGRQWDNVSGQWQDGWPLHKWPVCYLAGGLQWYVNLAVSYRTKGEEYITIPEGMVTDFASIPRAMWWKYPPAGDGINNYAPGVTVHDWLFMHRKTDEGRDLGRLECDGLMLEIMEYQQCSRVCCAEFKIFTDLCGGPMWDNRLAEDIV